MNEHHRQGDVLPLRRTDLTLADLQDRAKLESKDECILAEGEATGHAHRVHEAPKGSECLSMFNLDNTRILHIPESFGTITTTHEEHNTITLDPGFWEIRIQREYRDGEVQNVMD